MCLCTKVVVVGVDVGVLNVDFIFISCSIPLKKHELTCTQNHGYYPPYTQATSRSGTTTRNPS